MKKMERWANLFLIACFSLFLLGGMAVCVLREKETYSFYENRTLAPMPQASAETLLSGQWGSDMEAYLADHTAARNTMLKADTWIDLHILHRPVVNDVVVTEDCLLPFLTDWTEKTKQIPADTAALTENVKEVSDLTKSYGGLYYYVAVPCQYVFHEKQYPWYLENREDYSEKSVAALTESLQEAEVSFLDMGEVFAQTGWDPALSSGVDNHYSMQGAYLTYLTIMEQIHQDMGKDLPILSEGNYRLETLPNPYLGSRSRKLLELVPSEEKLQVLYPNEPVAFTRTDNGKQTASTVYALPQTPTENVLYSLYMGGDIASTLIDTQREELPSILVYGDSFTNAVECLLYYGFDRMYSFDLRYEQEKSLGDYILEYQPDVVVCIRDYESLLSTDANGGGAYVSR